MREADQDKTTQLEKLKFENTMALREALHEKQKEYDTLGLAKERLAMQLNMQLKQKDELVSQRAKLEARAALLFSQAFYKLSNNLKLFLKKMSLFTVE